MSDAFIRHLLANCPDCIYVCDVRTRRSTFRTRPLWAILGYERADVAAPDAVIPRQFLLPEDQVDIEDLFRRVAATADGDWIDVHFRMRDAAQDVRHFRARLAPLERDDEGRLLTFAGTITDATAMKRAEEAAHQASEAKTRFLADMSHELRTPLHVLLGSQELLAETRLDAEQARLVELGRGAGEHMAELVDDALDLAAVESGCLKLVEAPFSPAALVEGAVAAQRPRAAEKGLELRAEIEPTTPAAVRGDARRIGQIVGNFLSNAVKFTTAGAVAVRVEPREHRAGGVWLRFAVEDTGPGIESAAQERIFERFARADAAHAQGLPGSGLGLAIARDLAWEMEGHVGVASAPGAGATFWLDLHLPVVAAPAQRDPAPVQRAARTARRDVTVLVADDSPDNLRLAEAMVRAAGARAILAGGGAEALRLAETEAPDLILLDYRMPDLDGLQTATALRQRGFLTKILLLTANAGAALRDESRLYGVDDVVTKPLRLSEMRWCVERHATATPRAEEAA